MLSYVPFDSFQENQVQISAMLWQFNVLGEAVSHLQEQGFAEKHPEMPWKEMRAIRNRIVHGYSSVDITLLRKVSLEEIPKVPEQLENLPELQNLIQETRKIMQEKAAVLLTGVQDSRKQEKILRDELRYLICNQKLSQIDAETWKNLSIPQMVHLIQTVPESDRMQAYRKALEAIQLERCEKSPESGRES